MNILVTGGAGFIGSNFVHYWLKNHPDDTLTVIDKLTYAGHLSSLADVASRIRFIKADICDSSAVDSAMAHQELVVHFAAETHVDRSVFGPSAFVQTNVVGTQILLDFALKHRVRHFHHVSTDEVFGHLPLDQPAQKFSETSPYSPSSPYSASKAGADFLVRAWHTTFGLSVTISNTSNNYGLYADPEKMIPRFITNLILGKKVPLMGRGENVRDWCFVEDHCRAIDLIVHAALSDPQISGQTFCVGGNSERTNLQVTQAILKHLHKDESWIEYVPHRLGHDSRYAIDTSKINSLLGWQPLHDFDSGLSRTIDWFIAHRDWWEPLLTDRPDIDPAAQQKLVSKS